MTPSQFRSFLSKHKAYYPFLELLKLNQINVSIVHISKLKNDIWISESIDLDCEGWHEINEKYLKLLNN